MRIPQGRGLSYVCEIKSFHFLSPALGGVSVINIEGPHQSWIWIISMVGKILMTGIILMMEIIFIAASWGKLFSTFYGSILSASISLIMPRKDAKFSSCTRFSKPERTLLWLGLGGGRVKDASKGFSFISSLPNFIVPRAAEKDMRVYLALLMAGWEEDDLPFPPDLAFAAFSSGYLGFILFTPMASIIFLFYQSPWMRGVVSVELCFSLVSWKSRSRTALQKRKFCNTTNTSQ